MKVLAVGDVVGKPGREALKAALPDLRQQHQIDLIIANGENAAGGLGLTQSIAEEMFNSGVDMITSGNHIWKRKEIVQYIDRNVPVIRPLNYPPGVPGKGYYLLRDSVMVVNIIGRTFISNFDCPFRAMDELLKSINPKPKIIIVDFHAEATSEKMAMGWYLDGRVSAVFGTHTHVGTVDTRILPNGTAYVTDLGMVGPVESVIGANKEAVIHSFLTLMPTNLSIGRGDFQFNSVLINFNNDTGLAQSIKRIDMEIKNYES
ncbi:MAG: TIGR00282 family metallophosphoesterase [Chloroflexi bacterium]|nr:TIGR00282 family metallophosphoesterase [Chloroflexota bacterium]